jgi:hypothetical protein
MWIKTAYNDLINLDRIDRMEVTKDKGISYLNAYQDDATHFITHTSDDELANDLLECIAIEMQKGSTFCDVTDIEDDILELEAQQNEQFK